MGLNLLKMFNVKSPFQGALLGGTIVFIAFLIYEKYRKQQETAALEPQWRTPGTKIDKTLTPVTVQPSAAELETI